jgi:hypothetical protein
MIPEQRRSGGHAREEGEKRRKGGKSRSPSHDDSSVVRSASASAWMVKKRVHVNGNASASVIGSEIGI